MPGAADIDELEQQAVSLLARGDLDGAMGCAEQMPAAPSLLLRVVAADVDVRRQDMTLHRLERLTEEADANAAAGELDCRWWVAALTCEFLYWRSDPLAFEVANDALGRVTDAPLPPTPTLVGRGRLRRIAAIGSLFSWDAQGPKHGWALLEQAVTDLSRAGWEEEQAFTSAVFSAIWSAASYDDLDRSTQALREATARLKRLGSPYLPLVDAIRAYIAFVAGDLVGVHDALESVEKASGAIRPLEGYVRWVRTMIEVFTGGATPQLQRELHETGDLIAALLPQLGGSVAIITGNVMADLGVVDQARGWANRGRHLPTFSQYGDFDRQLLDARIDLLTTGDAAALDTIQDLLAQNRAVGLRRWAGIVGLRCARDCERVGLTAEADELRAEASTDMPGRETWTIWENWWARPTSGGGLGTPVRSELRLLCPDVEVVRKGKAVSVPASAARLLAVLAAEHRPVTLDRVADQLWPEIDLATGRNRLNVTLHRLRRALELDAGELVVRNADGLALDPGDEWRVDAWDFWVRSTGDVDDRLRAVRMYRSDLCARQFAYDDAVGPERDRLRDRWVDTALGLVAEGLMGRTELADLARVAGIDDDRLIEA